MGLAKALFHKVQRDDAMGAAAELAFRFMFALFPLLIFLAALSSYIARWLGMENPTQDILNEAGDRLPADVSSLLQEQLSQIFDNQNPGLLTITAVAAIWTASSGTKSVMKALNRVFEVDETRPFIRKQAVGVGLTIVGGFAFLLGAVILVVGQAAGDSVADAMGLGDVWGTVVNYARIPVVLLLITVAISLVYWSAPNAGLPLRWLSYGAVIFVVSWLLATLAFGFYVANFGSYNATYGSLGAVIILMTWLYFTSFLLLLGAEINVVLSRAGMTDTVPAEVQRDEGRRRQAEATGSD